MEKQKIYNLRLLFMSLILSLFFVQNAFSQPVIGLDNWYNHETNAKTGMPFHYLWTDTASADIQDGEKYLLPEGQKSQQLVSRMI